MAKRTISRRELREQADAVEARGKVAGEGATTKKKAVAGEKAVKKKPAARAKRTKTKVIVRKRLVWGVFSSSMKEEGRFPYSEKEAAEARAADLALKHKRTYFVQPIKEPLAPEEKPTAAAAAAAAPAAEAPKE